MGNSLGLDMTFTYCLKLLSVTSVLVKHAKDVVIWSYDNINAFYLLTKGNKHPTIHMKEGESPNVCIVEKYANTHYVCPKSVF